MSTYKPNAIKQVLHQSRRILARAWIKRINPVVIAITGSQGKTNTTSLLAALFPEAQVTDTNLDTIYNVPITALKLSPKHKLAIFELGIDHQGEMTRHLEIVTPNIAIITGISGVHGDAEHLGSLENIIREKRKMIECLKENDYAILNWDDLNVRNMAGFTQAQVLFFGSGSDAARHCQVWCPKADDLKLTTKGTSFIMNYEDQSLNMSTGLIGVQHLGNIMAAFLAYMTVNKHFPGAVGNSAYAPSDTTALLSHFSRVISQLKPLPGRMSVEKGPGDTILLNDSLRANPESTMAGIASLSLLDDIKGKRIAVLGEMGELGDLSESKHREIGEFIASLGNIDLVVGIGPLQRYLLEAAASKGMTEDKLIYADNVIIAARLLKEKIAAGDIIYLKGSLLRHLERILLLLEDEAAVKCPVISCPLYNNCSKCRYVLSSYPEKN